MNRGAIFGSLAVASMLLACGSTDVDLGSRPQFSNGGNTVTVLAYDGLTGAPVTGATLTARVGPHILTAQANGNAYTLSNVYGGATLPIKITAPQYLDFNGTIAPAANTNLANPVYSTKIAVLYANTAVPNGLTIKIYDSQDGAAVTAGQVILSMSETGYPADITATQSSSQLIAGNYGFVPRVATYTVTAGVATIPATDLIYGATYSVDVVGATDASGDYLQQDYNTAAGLSVTVPNVTPIQHIFLNKFDGEPVAVTASNDGTASDDQVPTGTLTITFAEPIAVCDKSDATDNPSAENYDKKYDFFTSTAKVVAAPTADNVNFRNGVSADGLTLTLSIVASNLVSPLPSGPNTVVPVTYSGPDPILIKAKGHKKCYNLNAIKLRGGATLNMDVNIVNTNPY